MVITNSASPGLTATSQKGPSREMEHRSQIGGGPTAGLPWLSLDLPLPPSVNRFTKGLGNQSRIVREWVKNADGCFWLNRRRLTHIIGEFEAEITFRRHPGSDLDNRLKPLLDFLQRVQLIQNDNLCMKLTVMWGEPLLGCEVRLRPWMT